MMCILLNLNMCWPLMNLYERRQYFPISGTYNTIQMYHIMMPQLLHLKKTSMITNTIPH